MEEAQQLADRVVVLAKGRIVAEGTPDELGSDDATTLVGFRLPAYHDSLPLPDGATVERGTVSFRTATPDRATSRPLLEWAAAARHGARTPDRHASHARGRLSRSHRPRRWPHDALIDR